MSIATACTRNSPADSARLITMSYLQAHAQTKPGSGLLPSLEAACFLVTASQAPSCVRCYLRFTKLPATTMHRTDSIGSARN